MTSAKAIISDDGIYRYWLRREVPLTLKSRADSDDICLFIMLNPSTADGHQDDPTIKRCVGYAKANGFASIEVVNLFAYRATDPKNMIAALNRGIDIRGPGNDEHIRQAYRRSTMTIAAWGTNARNWRVKEVLDMPGIAELFCLGITAEGHPRHPLYLRRDAKIKMWKPNV